MRKINAGPPLTGRPLRGMDLPQSRQALGNCAHARVSVYLAVFATMAVAAPAFGQAGKPVSPTTGDSCAGVMARVDAARATAPGRYTKVLMAADARCLGVTERAEGADDHARRVRQGVQA